VDYQDIIYTKEAGIATITMNRPDKLNSFTQRTLEEMVTALGDAGKDSDVKVVIISGSGRGFCTGGDLSEIITDPIKALEGAKKVRELMHRLYFDLKRFEKPTIAAVNGAAVAEGFTIALLCDIRIASDKARLGDGVIRFGLVPDIGGTCLLPRIVGMRALEDLLTGRLLDAAEAERMGLVGRVVPHEKLQSATQELAATIAKGPSIAHRLTKALVYRQLDIDLESAIKDQSLAAQVNDVSEDHAEGIKAFLGKRPPVFKGR
jgi:enoyl-CoA hydratase/carnithine racemase